MDKQNASTQNGTESVQKKSNKSRVIVVVAIIAAAIILLSVLYSGSDLKYNSEIKSDYAKAIDDLSQIMFYKPDSIDGIRFFAPNDDELPVEVHIFTTRDPVGDGKHLEHRECIYEFDRKTYDSLQRAKEIGDLKNYVKILDSCFHEMNDSKRIYSETRTDLKFKKEEDEAKFFRLFNLNDHGLDQIGLFIQFNNFDMTEDEDFYHLTFTIQGLSLVNTSTKTDVENMPLNMSEKTLAKVLKKKDMDIYEVDYKLTFEVPSNQNYYIDSKNGHVEYLEYYFSGQNEIEQVIYNLKVEPTFVRKADLIELKMQYGVFDFEQPSK